ncbi:selenocysteine-specific translation elongation factor [Campylobacter sp. 19-13652]|uniref:selenocysteine-specific translation elongation factor n=1 Tax=Campylobacter sp. 19-13652 TaxID=2840180 RepID=UPI001C74359D|nr:selenocysteine-specific translation elongation factor [Campylobacter sp. 19-13652]BCX78890.1 selenocysteine-specific translation elongation factor [Campylobacter sp. 19-13652]
MSVILGIIGHVDHGKTSLVRAMNGFDGDSTEAEKSRGITIELSFSNLKQGENEVSFIDVPGHESLVKTMVSGAFGFDAALLVVAADDGIMPQSKEHMRVLSLLGLKDVILAVNKCDLTSKERAQEVAKSVHDELSTLGLRLLSTFFTSTKTEQSISELKEYLLKLQPKPKQINDMFRCYIDRCFSIKGVGQIVAGTVLEGSVGAGDRVWVCDLGKDANVRQVQTHEREITRALAGERAALNLVGVSGLSKGMLLSKKGLLRGFYEADCLFLGEISHLSDVLFCVGSRQVGAKAFILSDKDGQKLVSFKFKSQLFLKFKDPFIVLRNGRLIGGGRVLNPIIEPLKKPLKIELLKALAKDDLKSAFEILKNAHKNGFGIISSYQRFGLTHTKALQIANTLDDSFVDEKMLNIYPLSTVSRVKEFISFIISKNQNALLSATSVALKLGWASALLAQKAIDELESNKILECENGVYFKRGADFSQIKIKLENEIYSIIKDAGLTPRAPYNIYDELEIDRVSGDNALKKLTKNNQVIRLAHNLFVAKTELEKALNTLKTLAKKEAGVGVQEVKEELNLSRKYAIAYLERLDLEPDIIKLSDKRVLKSEK